MSRLRRMDPRERIVTRIPLDELWTANGRMDAVRVRTSATRTWRS